MKKLNKGSPQSLNFTKLDILPARARIPHKWGEKKLH